MLNLQWICEHTETVKNVIATVMNEETAQDIQDMKDITEEGVEVAIQTIDDIKQMKEVTIKAVATLFDLLREPLEEAGYTFDMVRELPSQEAEEARKRLLYLQESA